MSNFCLLRECRNDLRKLSFVMADSRQSKDGFKQRIFKKRHSKAFFQAILNSMHILGSVTRPASKPNGYKTVSHMYLHVVPKWPTMKRKRKVLSLIFRFSPTVFFPSCSTRFMYPNQCKA